LLVAISFLSDYFQLCINILQDQTELISLGRRAGVSLGSLGAAWSATGVQAFLDFWGVRWIAGEYLRPELAMAGRSVRGMSDTVFGPDVSA